MSYKIKQDISIGKNLKELRKNAKLSQEEVAAKLSFTVIRKYSQQLINNADKQGAIKNRELIAFKNNQFSVFNYIPL